MVIQSLSHAHTHSPTLIMAHPYDPWLRAGPPQEEGERVWLVGHARRSSRRLDGPAGAGPAQGGPMSSYTPEPQMCSGLHYPPEGLQDGAASTGSAAAGAGLLVVLRGGAAGMPRVPPLDRNRSVAPAVALPARPPAAVPTA